MMKNNNKNSISAVAALLLFAVFAVGILSVLLGGAKVYRRLTQSGQISYDSRTCTQYIATRIRQAPTPESITVAPFGDADALLIYEQIQSEEYLTRVYCFDGWLMELFTAADGDFSPADGEKIMPMQDLSLQLVNGLITIDLMDSSGITQHLQLHLRGSGEVAQ